MKNIRIIEDEQFLASAVPKEFYPKRFAIATNFVIISKDKGFLLFNYEPEKWNQWYPFFSSVADLYEFHGVTYSDLVDEFNSKILSLSHVKRRFEKGKKDLFKILNISGGSISYKKDPVSPEYWLKYSKTQDIWTMYYMEFVQVSKISEIDFSKLQTNIVDFLDLSADSLDHAIEEGKFKNVEIVDNTLDILKNKELLSQLLEQAID